MNKIEKQKIGEIPVDAGLMMLIDPCYIIGKNFKKGKDDSKNEKWREFLEYIYEKGYDGDFCHLKELGGIIVSSGYGDGEYPVFIKKQDGRVKELTIKFF